MKKKNKNKNKKLNKQTSQPFDLSNYNFAALATADSHKIPTAFFVKKQQKNNKINSKERKKKQFPTFDNRGAGKSMYSHNYKHLEKNHYLPFFHGSQDEIEQIKKIIRTGKSKKLKKLFNYLDDNNQITIQTLISLINFQKVPTKKSKRKIIPLKFNLENTAKKTSNYIFTFPEKTKKSKSLLKKCLDKKKLFYYYIQRALKKITKIARNIHRYDTTHILPYSFYRTMDQFTPSYVFKYFRSKKNYINTISDLDYWVNYEFALWLDVKDSLNCTREEFHKAFWISKTEELEWLRRDEYILKNSFLNLKEHLAAKKKKHKPRQLPLRYVKCLTRRNLKGMFLRLRLPKKYNLLQLSKINLKESERIYKNRLKLFQTLDKNILWLRDAQRKHFLQNISEKDFQFYFQISKNEDQKNYYAKIDKIEERMCRRVRRLERQKFIKKKSTIIPSIWRKNKAYRKIFWWEEFNTVL